MVNAGCNEHTHHSCEGVSNNMERFQCQADKGEDAEGVFNTNHSLLLWKGHGRT